MLEARSSSISADDKWAAGFGRGKAMGNGGGSGDCSFNCSFKGGV
jgi:hypothetical protein